MQKIIPFLWFDNNAEEAVNFYTSSFKDSKIGNIARYGEAGAQASGRPKGSVMTVEFRLNGQEFAAINGGPEFKFTPAISFFVACKTEQEINQLWEKLSSGGKILMEFEKYPFSEKFGWLEDQFGISWQLSLTGEKQEIYPFLMFVGEHHGKAEEAINFYTSVFEDSSIKKIEHYGPGQPEPEGSIMHALFSLNGQEFMATESKRDHQFDFTPAISFLVNCKNQQEVDDLWNKFTAEGEPVECGWLKDEFGVSWQIVPIMLKEMLQDRDPKRAERVMNAMLKMDKIDIETLKRAYEEK